MYYKNLIIFILFSHQFAFSQEIKKVLFLGNSYTYVNDLPQIINTLAKSTGDSLFYNSNTPGGYTLQGHSTNATSLSLIKSGNWDYVVLQEQSQLPSSPIEQVQTETFPFAQQLNDSIKMYNSCAETMFYMTWGRKNGDAQYCEEWPPVCTYTGMDSLLFERYMMMADSNHALVSPIGAVWHYIHDNFPTIELYSTDESHPSLAGSYAAACCFYATIFRKNPLLISSNYTLPATDAENIRHAAKTVVFDSLLKWHIGEYDPVADFQYNVSSNNFVSFSNLSLNANAYLWYFGDGDSSITASPVHVYSNSGTYLAKLVAFFCDKSDTIELSINIQNQSTITAIDRQKINIFPNPVKDKAVVSLAGILSVKIYNVTGKEMPLIHSKETNETIIDLSGNPSGIYYLQIISKEATFTTILVKE